MTQPRVDAAAIAKLSIYLDLIEKNARNPRAVLEYTGVCKKVLELAIYEANIAIRTGNANGIAYVVQSQKTQPTVQKPQVIQAPQPVVQEKEAVSQTDMYMRRAYNIRLNINIFRASTVRGAGYTVAELKCFLRAANCRCSGNKCMLMNRLNAYLWTGVSQ